MGREVERVAEKCIRIVDQGIYAPELLERLDGACNQEASLGLYLVILQKIFPASCSKLSLIFACFDDGGVKSCYFCWGTVVVVKALEDGEGGFRFGMRC